MALTQISTGGIKDDAVTDAKLPANSVGNSEMKDDAVGVAELSATGTASSSTFLRGDNSWVTPTDTNTQLAFANDANNRVVTGDGSGGLNGEANLTFDGSDLAVTSGKLVVGATGTTGETWNQNALIVGTETLALGRAEANNAGPHLHFYKSRNGTWGSNTIVQDDDQLGNIIWYADDGNDYKSPAAMIQACSDGTPGTNDMPGRLVFYTTPDGTESNTERLRIDSSGNLRLNNADSLIHTSADTSRLRLFGGSAASVSNGAALTLHGVNHSSGNYADLAAATGGTIQFRVGTSEKLRIQAGGGISFNGDTAAANALDDYEEGTWTPGLKFGSASTGMTYNWSPAGVYTKIGRQVTVKFGWDWSSKGSATGALQVTGLPFTSTHTAYNHFTGSVITFNGPNADGSMTSYLSSTNINFRMHNDANLNVSPTQTDFDDDTKVMGTITYFV